MKFPGWHIWLQSVFSRRGRSRPARRRYSRLRLELLEDRIAPANLTLTSAFLVNGNDQPIAAPDKGEEVFIQANWTTQSIPSNATYHIDFNVDGVVLSS